MSNTAANPAQQTPRLLLLDGHSLAYRAFFALPVENFSTTSGQPTNAVYGFTSMLINTLRDERPTHVAVAFDVSRQTFRSAQYPEYKAGRSATPSEFKGQIPLIHEVLDAMGIRTFEVDGYEADDVIATLTTTAHAKDADVFIITGDRDALQLVDDHTTVLYPRKGVSDLARLDPAAVEEKYGVTPAQYSDLAALVGEQSDNLPGVPGVGPGFAAKWLRQYGDLESVLAHADEIKGKKGEALREHLEQVRQNRSLNALVTDLRLDGEFADLELAQIDRAAVHEVFDALQFRVLRDRLFDSLGDQVASAGHATQIDVETLTESQIRSWIAAHCPAGSAAAGVAAVTSTTLGRTEVSAIAVAAKDSAVAVVETPTGRLPQALLDWLADPGCRKATHDGKELQRAGLAAGITVQGVTFDTALAAYVLLPGQRSFDLSDLAARFLDRDLNPTSESGQGALFSETGQDQNTDLGQQARAVLDLSEVLSSRLAQRGGGQLLESIELPVMGILAQMEFDGIAVDLDELKALESTFADRMRDTQSRAHELAGREFNLGSPKQLQAVLFDERGLPKTKKIKTGYTTDADALAALYAKSEDPLLEEILRWRDVSKLRQTVAGLIPLVDQEGRIHTTFQQTVAATGRLSSKDPNLQNIPVRTAEGRRIRAAFVAGRQYDQLMTADYSQIEMRIMAHLCGDEALIAAFRSGEDLHTSVARQVFDPADGRVDAEHRRRIKAMSYGLAYGLSAYGLSQQLGIEPDEARGLMDTYFERFGGVRDYLHEVVERARATGYTETMFGRRRYLPDLTSDVRQRREMAERMALNAPIQGSAADIIKVAMIRIADTLRQDGLRSRMLLQVHDELVLEIAEGEWDIVHDLVREGMASAADLTVPLDVSIGGGLNWDAAAH